MASRTPEEFARLVASYLEDQKKLIETHLRLIAGFASKLPQSQPVTASTKTKQPQVAKTPTQSSQAAAPKPVQQKVAPVGSSADSDDEDDFEDEPPPVVVKSIAPAKKETAAAVRKREATEAAGDPGAKKQRKKKEKKDPNKPKKPPTGYLLYSAAVFPSVKAAHPEVPQKELMSMVGSMWTQLPAAEKEPYMKRYDEVNADYKLKLEEYTKSNAGITIAQRSPTMAAVLQESASRGPAVTSAPTASTSAADADAEAKKRERKEKKELKKRKAEQEAAAAATAQVDEEPAYDDVVEEEVIIEVPEKKKKKKSKHHDEDYD